MDEYLNITGAAVEETAVVLGEYPIVTHQMPYKAFNVVNQRNDKM